MDPVKYFQIPKFLGEVRLGGYYIVPSISLKTDTSKSTLWLDLETKKEHFSKNKSGPFSFFIIRYTSGTQRDFKIPDLDKFNDLFKMFPRKYGLSINKIVEMVLNPQLTGDPQFTDYLTNFINEKFKSQDLDSLSIFAKMIENLPQESITTLLSDERYSLLFGELDDDEMFSNKSATETVIFDVPNLTKKDFMKCFDDIIIDPKILKETFVAMNINDILKGRVPKKGGAILIDHGGTGKSMMKKGMIDFWKKMGGSVKEKDQGQISSYVNAAPQLIRIWYRGGSMATNSGPSIAEEDLVQAAKKKKIPSLLVIDEAEEFIIEDRGYVSKKPIDGSLNSLKRFIQDFSKGGVTGYVVTLLIANVDRENIHEPLQQGAERLTIVEYGPPKRDDEWNQIINIGFKHLKFNVYSVDVNFISRLLLYHNKKVSHEKYMISPRRFLGFCSEYYDLYSKGGGNFVSKEEVYDSMFNSKEELKWDIDYKVFIENLIKDVLINQLNKDNNINTKESIIDEYYSILNQNFKENKNEENKINLSNKEKDSLKKAFLHFQNFNRDYFDENYLNNRYRFLKNYRNILLAFINLLEKFKVESKILTYIRSLLTLVEYDINNNERNTTKVELFQMLKGHYSNVNTNLKNIIDKL